MEEWEYGLRLDLNMTNKKEKYVIFSGYNKKSTEVKAFLDKLDKNLDDYEGITNKVIIAGDLNAKVGEENDIAETGIEKIMQQTRKTEDKETRREGRILARWCENRAMAIMNGRAKGDETGKITCIGHGNG